jgi:hypothetical protein
LGQIELSIKYFKLGLLGTSFLETGDKMRSQDENSTTVQRRKKIQVTELSNF